MPDRWFYAQGAQVHGPVSTDRVRQLVAQGDLLPDTELWAEVADRKQASQTCKASELAPAVPAQGVPDWLGDVAGAEEARAGEGQGELDWLADVEVPATQPEAAVEALPEVVEVPRPPGTAGPLRVGAGGATSRGQVRERNEDRFLVQHVVWSDGDQGHELALLVVADGMGGHNAGDKAAAIAVRTVATVMSPVLVGILQGPSVESGMAVLGRHLDKAIQDAHAAVLKRADADPACKGMGCTLALVVIWNSHALLRHVGDCRIHHHHGADVRQVTRDHTLVNRMVELGQLTPEEAAKHPNRNELTQGIGKKGPVEPSREELDLAAGDHLVLACDGLAAHVEEDQLRETVTNWTGAAVDLAQQLVDMANDGGGTDNCTVVVARCG